VTEDELIALLRERNAQRHDAIERTARPPRPLRPVASKDDVLQAERELGVQFPSLLRRIYLEVADGNFGPGYGFFPLKDVIAETLDKRDLGPPHAGSWQSDFLCICTFGCTFYAAVDCATGAVRLFEEHQGVYDEPEPLKEWLAAWLQSKLNPYGRMLPLPESECASSATTTVTAPR
jgi:hypothetical protein